MTPACRSLRTALLGALVACAALGCFALRKDYEEKRFFMFTAQRPGAARTGGSPESLRVRRFRASPACTGRQMVYRTGELTYESDFYRELFVRPADLIDQQTLAWLADSGLFAHVVDPSAPADARYVLDGNVVECYGDYRDPEAPAAVLSMQFMVLDDIGARPRIVHMADYTSGVPIGTADPATLAAGWAEGLSEILARLEQDVAALDLDPEAE